MRKKYVSPIVEALEIEDVLYDSEQDNIFTDELEPGNGGSWGDFDEEEDNFEF